MPQYAQEIEATLTAEAQKRQRFYQQISEGEKVEFINGEVIIHSPVKMRHNLVAGRLYALMRTYAMLNDAGFVGYEKIMVSLTRNDYEPDICFFNQAKAAHFTPDQMHFPAPDLVVEVLSSSTEAVDRGIKFDDYAAHGVAEYWLVDPDKELVEQYRLQGQTYELVVKARTGQLESLALPHFVIPIRAIFDEQENRAALQQMLSTT